MSGKKNLLHSTSHQYWLTDYGVSCDKPCDLSWAVTGSNAIREVYVVFHRETRKIPGHSPKNDVILPSKSFQISEYVILQ